MTATKLSSMTPAEFFYRHAGWGYHPGRETPEEGRRRGAEQLATAEAWLAQQPGHTIQWVEDDDADRSFLPKRDCRPLFGCVVSAAVDGKEEKASLWGIDLGKRPKADDPYKRVVVAELALELMPGNG